ncbi:DJ-1/PfpI family protein [Vibrio celticus]|uniref:Chaperone protein YajL n=1 Tax=Vibrio celticus TaxID=446372 RepID=A0A1C3JIS8_9VIBR|nr:DJ-1/PfpI family protein [Vibrio celticus]SBT15110.1 Chaperone protein YajL [Vibrio celticus]
MKIIALLLSDGFEEGEAINVIDILRRLELSVKILSCDQTVSLTSYHGVKIVADDLLSSKIQCDFDAIVLVGGPPNTDKLGTDSQVIRFIERHISMSAYIAALCSSGAKVLAKNSLLGSHHYVCCGNFHQNYSDGSYINQPVVMDGQFITGQDYGYTIDFAFAIAEVLLGDTRTRSNDVSDVDWVAKHINYRRFTEYKL